MYTPHFTTYTPFSTRSGGYQNRVSGIIFHDTTRTRSSPTTRSTPHSFYLIAATDLAPPPVGELYVSDEKLIAAANTWAGAHGYALIVSRSNKNKRGIKDKI